MRRLDRSALRAMLKTGLENLFKDRDLMNAINVFPVADADTGDNLYHTFLPVYRELAAGKGDGGLKRLMAEALLPAARGNSGVIFSQYLFTFVRALEDKPEITARELAGGFAAASEEAYQSVQNPREGTMLTLMRTVAECAASSGPEDPPLEELFRKATARTRKALDETKDLLPACKKAGVVDSGALGFFLFFEGMGLGLEHRDIDTGRFDTPQSPGKTEESSSEFAWCVQWVLESESHLRKTYFDLLNPFGDSLVISDNGEYLSIHLHTSLPEEAEAVLASRGRIVRSKMDSLSAPSRSVEILTDTSVDLPPEIEARGEVRTVPFNLFVGEQAFLDRVEMSRGEFYRRLKETALLLKTSQPPPLAWLKAYEEGLKKARELLVFTLSSHLSGSHSSAEAAVRMLPEALRERVHVVDTLNVCAGAGLLVLQAMDLLRDGLPAAEVMAAMEQRKGRILASIFLDSMDQVVRGGRAPAAAGKIVRWTGVKPLVTLHGGTIVKAGALLSGRNGERKLVRRFMKTLEPGKTYSLGIVHTDNPDAADRLEHEIRRRFHPFTYIYKTAASPVLGAHAGSGAFALFALED